MIRRITRWLSGTSCVSAGLLCGHDDNGPNAFEAVGHATRKTARDQRHWHVVDVVRMHRNTKIITQQLWASYPISVGLQGHDFNEYTLYAHNTTRPHLPRLIDSLFPINLDSRIIAVHTSTTNKSSGQPAENPERKKIERRCTIVHAPDHQARIVTVTDHKIANCHQTLKPHWDCASLYEILERTSRTMSILYPKTLQLKLGLLGYKHHCNYYFFLRTAADIEVLTQTLHNCTTLKRSSE